MVFVQRPNFQMEGPVGVMKQLEALGRILQLTDLQLFKHLSQIGAESHLFAFRMLLVLFRRELSFDDALSMWEASLMSIKFWCINVLLLTFKWYSREPICTLIWIKIKLLPFPRCSGVYKSCLCEVREVQHWWISEVLSRTFEI